MLLEKRSLVCLCLHFATLVFLSSPSSFSPLSSAQASSSTSASGAPLPSVAGTKVTVAHSWKTNSPAVCVSALLCACFLSPLSTCFWAVSRCDLAHFKVCLKHAHVGTQTELRVIGCVCRWRKGGTDPLLTHAQLTSLYRRVPIFQYLTLSSLFADRDKFHSPKREWWMSNETDEWRWMLFVSYMINYSNKPFLLFWQLTFHLEPEPSSPLYSKYYMQPFS